MKANKRTPFGLGLRILGTTALAAELVLVMTPAAHADLPSYPVITVPLPPGSTEPSSMTFNSATGMVHTIAIGSDQGIVFDPKTDKVVAVVPVGTQPLSTGLSPDKSVVYTVSGGDDSVTAYDAKTYRVLWKMPLVSAAPCASWDVGAYTPTGWMYYTCGGSANTVGAFVWDTGKPAIDPATGKPLVIQVGAEPNVIKIDETTHTAFATAGGDNTVSVIDLPTAPGPSKDPNANKRIADIPVGPGPWGMTSGGGILYVSSAEGDTVTMVDMATYRVLGHFHVDAGPRNMALVPDRHKLYVACNGSSTVVEVDTITHQITARVTVGAAPHGIVYVPAEHSLYVTNRGGASISVIRLPADPG